MVIVPNMIASTMASAAMPVKAGTLEAVSSSMVRIGLTTELNSPSGISVGLDSFPLELYNSDTPGQPAFVTLIVPAHTLNGHNTIDIPAQEVHVHSEPELRKMLVRAFNSETATVGIRGTSTAKLGAVEYPVNLNKTVELGGLRNLNGLVVESTNPLAPAAADGSNLEGSIMLPNFSPLGLGLGNMTLNMYAEGLQVGTVSARDVYAKPGNQSVAYTGTLDVDTVSQNMELVLKQAKELNGIELVIRGVQMTVDGQHVSYLDDVVQLIQVKTVVDICVAKALMPLDKIPLSALNLMPMSALVGC